MEDFFLLVLIKYTIMIQVVKITVPAMTYTVKLIDGLLRDGGLQGVVSG